MRNLIQTLIDNKDTLIEGIVYSVKEEIFQKDDDFFRSRKQAVKTIDFHYEDLEIYYEAIWRDLKAVKRDFCELNLKTLRLDIFKLIIVSIKLMANIDKATESKTYWDFYGEGEEE